MRDGSREEGKAGLNRKGGMQVERSGGWKGRKGCIA